MDVVVDAGQCRNCGIEWRLTLTHWGRTWHVVAWTRYTNDAWIALTDEHTYSQLGAWFVRRRVRRSFEWGDRHCLGSFSGYDRHR